MLIDLTINSAGALHPAPSISRPSPPMKYNDRQGATYGSDSKASLVLQKAEDPRFARALNALQGSFYQPGERCHRTTASITVARKKREIRCLLIRGTEEEGGGRTGASFSPGVFACECVCVSGVARGLGA